MSIPSASGYQDYSAYIEPILSDQILARFACESMFTDLTTSGYLDPLKRCGDKIRYMRSPRAVVHPYIKNMKMEEDEIHSDTVIVGDSKAAYFRVKMNDIDDHQICNARQLIDMYTRDAMHQFKQLIELDVLYQMIGNVDPANRGQCAGARSRCYNLGDCGCCLEVDCENFYKLLMTVYAVLAEACVVTPGHGQHICGPGNSGGELFIVLPMKAYPIFIEGLSKGFCCPITDSTPLITGRIPDKVHGFHLFFSHETPWYPEDGKQVFHIIAGRRDATGFCVTMERSKVCEPCDDWAKFYMGLIVWSAGVIYPEALVHARVCFDWEGIEKAA